MWLAGAGAVRVPLARARNPVMALARRMAAVASAVAAVRVFPVSARARPAGTATSRTPAARWPAEASLARSHSSSMPMVMAMLVTARSGLPSALRMNGSAMLAASCATVAMVMARPRRAAACPRGCGARPRVARAPQMPAPAAAAARAMAIGSLAGQPAARVPRTSHSAAKASWNSEPA